MISGLGVTVRLVLAVTPLSDAEIAVEPATVAEAKPRVLIVATDGLDDVHRTWPVMFKVDPSE